MPDLVALTDQRKVLWIFVFVSMIQKLDMKQAEQRIHISTMQARRTMTGVSLPRASNKPAITIVTPPHHPDLVPERLPNHAIKHPLHPLIIIALSSPQPPSPPTGSVARLAAHSRPWIAYAATSDLPCVIAYIFRSYLQLLAVNWLACSHATNSDMHDKSRSKLICLAVHHSVMMNLDDYCSDIFGYA